eukprot:TRINITY_DN22382_c0_g1_i1.p1 TRINITY_DN22382_c0_g1~~TRINITY_DN22382_c0_g1_i1.p1  ORF type:complete len:401 (-),score=111.08 TRINITY_DN22382_c0_g1_i1:119-1273(-)
MTEDTAEDAPAAPTKGNAQADKEAFLQSFRKEQQAVEEALEALRLEGAAAGASQINERLDALLLRVQAMEVAFNCAASELTKYDVQRCRLTCRDMEGEISKLREQLAPRKKFGFKRNSVPKPAAVEEPAKASSVEGAGAAGADAYVAKATSSSAAAVAPSVNGSGGEAFNGELFEKLKGEVIVRGNGELAGRDVTLRDLETCQIQLLDRIGAMHCHGLRGCEIVVGAIGSSALFYDCKDCLITLAAKQLRFHDSERVALHLHTLSGPVIEHCRRMLFSPHDLRYPGLQDHVHAASLGELPALDALRSGIWSDVQDFNWHKRQASPNWRLVPVELRRRPLELTTGAGDLPKSPAHLEALEALFGRCRSCWEDAEPQGRLAEEDEF